MSTTRMMTGVGYAYDPGEQVNGLSVVRMVRRNPPAYEMRCGRCMSLSTESHRDIQHGHVQCRNSACRLGKLQGVNEANESLAQFTRREEERERQRTRALEDQFKSLHRQIAKTTTEYVSGGWDKSFYLDPRTEAIAADMEHSQYEQQVFVQNEVDSFIRQTPEYRPTQKNSEAIMSYVERNGGWRFGIITIPTLTAAYKRLDELGMLERHSDVQPEPQTLESVYEPIVETRIEEPKPAPKTTVTGIDPANGLPREYTRREVDLMSSEQYRRCFAVTKSMLALPNRGPDSRLPR
jgi:hypothetical protein